MSVVELARRVEALEGPDREVDRLIAPLVGIRVVDEGHPLGQCYYDGNGHGVPLPLFTASLDAAMTLVPEGWDCAAGTKADHGWAYLHNRQSHFVGIGTRRNPNLRWYETKAPTPALALTAAALRAMIAKAVEEGGDG